MRVDVRYLGASGVRATARGEALAFAPNLAREAVAFDAAIGHVSAELIAPYPPGIPVVAPGEQITTAVLDALEQARASGVRIAYAADPTLRTLRVIAAPTI